MGVAGKKRYPSNDTQVMIDIHNEVVDVNISQHLSDYNEEEEEEGDCREEAHAAPFNLVSNDESGFYQAVWPNALHFQIVCRILE